MASDGQHDALSSPRATVTARHGVGIGEMDWTEMLDEIDAIAAQLVGQVLFLESVAGHSIAIAEDCRKVRFRRGTFESEGCP